MASKDDGTGGALGERKAELERLFNQHHGKLYRCYVRRCPNDVEDLLQTIFESIAKELETIDREVPIDKWIWRIARNRYVDLLRKKSRKHSSTTRPPSFDGPAADPEELSLEPIDNASDPWPGVERRMGNAELLSDLVDTIKALMEREALSLDELRVIELRYVDDFSYREIAEILNEREDALQMRVSRAMLKIRHEMTRKKGSKR